MLNSLLGYFSYDLGIDLGSSNIYITQKDKGIVVNQPCVASIVKKNKQLIAVGDKAKEMLGKSPDTIEVIYPIKNGVISDLDTAEKILQHYIKELHKTSKESSPKIPRPKVVISIPYGTTEVERRAVVKIAKNAGCRQINLVESPFATALGLGLNVMSSKGNLVVNIGGGTTEIAIISLGGIVVGKSLKIAGINMDEAIVSYVKNRFSVLIGASSAENVKMRVADFNLKSERTNSESITCRGRNIKTGLPQVITLSKLDVEAALGELIDQINEAIKVVVEETPPDLVSDIIESGIYLVGGVSKIRGLSSVISLETKIKVNLPKDSEIITAKGCEILLNDTELLKTIEKKVN
ncbi:rod shape-determining protein [bacterium]|nr:rod shape-determining protein [bacterium]